MYKLSQSVCLSVRASNTVYFVFMVFELSLVF